MIEEVRERLRERIKRGATVDELETIIRMSRGLTQADRWRLWSWAWAYDPEDEGRARSVRALLGQPRRGSLTPRFH
jgi:hypothetical protein